MGGYRVSDWELFTKSYFGEQGTPGKPVPFLVEVIDITGGTTLVVTDVFGNQHTFTMVAANDVLKRAALPMLVSGVLPGTNVTSFNAVYF